MYITNTRDTLIAFASCAKHARDMTSQSTAVPRKWRETNKVPFLLITVKLQSFVYVNLITGNTSLELTWLGGVEVQPDR